HLMTFTDGWTKTIEYQQEDPRLPLDVLTFHRSKGVKGMVVTPLVLGTTNLGWIKLSSRTLPDCADAEWWRVVLIEAIARQAGLALHHHRIVERSRIEERRKATPEERDRPGRDIHDNPPPGVRAAPEPLA